MQELRVNEKGEAVYKGYHLVVDGKYLKAASLTNVTLSSSVCCIFIHFFGMAELVTESTQSIELHEIEEEHPIQVSASVPS